MQSVTKSFCKTRAANLSERKKTNSFYFTKYGANMGQPRLKGHGPAGPIFFFYRERENGPSWSVRGPCYQLSGPCSLAHVPRSVPLGPLLGPGFSSPLSSDVAHFERLAHQISLWARNRRSGLRSIVHRRVTNSYSFVLEKILRITRRKAIRDENPNKAPHGYS